MLWKMVSTIKVQNTQCIINGLRYVLKKRTPAWCFYMAWVKWHLWPQIQLAFIGRIPISVHFTDFSKTVNMTSTKHVSNAQPPHVTDSTWFQKTMPVVIYLPPVWLIQSTNPLLISLLLVSNYSNRVCPSAGHFCRALSEGSETLVRPSIITDSFHRGHISLPPAYPPCDESAPIQTVIWTPSAMLHILLTPSGRDPCLVRALFLLHLILGDLQRQGEGDW